jgi:predicted ATP-dependent serine protease
MAYVDALCAGDGITPSSVILLTGTGGCGKTTFELQLADAIMATGNLALVNTNEESLYQVRKTVRRLGLKNGFIPAYKKEIHQVIENADKVRERYPDKKLFLFIDSLQTLELDSGGVGRPMTKMNAGVECTYALTNWAKKNYTVVFLLGQVGKDGTFLGKNEIKHIVDMHISLCIDTDRK